MSEILTGTTKRKSGNIKRITRLIRVDLTPMVDLGFLLITFFVFTTAMAEPKAMDLVYPVDKDTTHVMLCESCVLTVLIGEENKIGYYEGSHPEIAIQTDYSPEGLRKKIIEKKAEVISKRSTDQFVLIVKPSDGAELGNLVDVIDEAVICRVKRYYIDTPGRKDILALEKF